VFEQKLKFCRENISIFILAVHAVAVGYNQAPSRESLHITISVNFSYMENTSMTLVSVYD